MPNQIDTERLAVSSFAGYQVRLARDSSDVLAAQALRFSVFNLELREGLAESFATGLDRDPFDDVCDHLIVEHQSSGQVVGTYRLQSGVRAAAHRGYYSEQEFDMAPFAGVRAEVLELGRACVDRHHRNLAVLGLLWKGIAAYATGHGCRYLIGCSSITSQDPRAGASAYAELYRKHLAPAQWRTVPLPAYECALDQLLSDPPKIPKLLRAYLGLGAWVCGPPALDAQFKTIDFLTLLDVEALTPVVRNRFFAAEHT